jgi:hypothetical protein
MLIATAHGVPPLLANILLPGKIGAANEGPNALLLFQKRKLGQIQRTFSRILANTLGAGVQLATPEGKNATLTKEQFLGTKFSKGEKDPMTGQPGTPKDDGGADLRAGQRLQDGARRHDARRAGHDGAHEGADGGLGSQPGGRSARRRQRPQEGRPEVHRS